MGYSKHITLASKLKQAYGGLHQKSWTALVAALTLISEEGPGTRGTGTLELSPRSAKFDFFWA